MFDFFKKTEIIKEPRTVEIDGEIWYVAKDICDILGTDTRDVPKTLDSDYLCYSIIQTKGGSQKMSVINEIGCSQLIANSRKLTTKQKNDLFQNLGINSVGFGTKEIAFVSELKEIFETAGIKIELQKQVLSYRLDAYLPKYKLAIEFDESHHNYQKDQDLKRQKAIENELNCKFIRLSENNPNSFNIGLILKKIL